MKKIVREHINEKFVEDSDPISDMGIGLYAHRNFTDKKDFIEFLIKFIPLILRTDSIPEYILMGGAVINNQIFLKIQSYLKEYVTFNGISVIKPACEVYWWPEMIQNKLQSMGYSKFN